MTTIKLVDPQSGQEVQIGVMQLPQVCGLCAKELKGQWGMATADGLGWTCLHHHVRRLMNLEMTPELRARAQARDQLSGSMPGDALTVTGSLMAALGLEAVA